MDTEREINILRKELDRLKSELSRMPKPHIVQGRERTLIKRDPSNVRVSDLLNHEVAIFDDGADTIGRLFRHNGKLYKINATEVT